MMRNWLRRGLLVGLVGGLWIGALAPPATPQTDQPQSGAAATPAGFLDTPLALLQNPAVQRDLELLDEQAKSAAAIAAKLRLEIHNAYLEVAEFPPELRADAVSAVERRIASLKVQAEQVLFDEILLPHQAKRLEQIRARTQLRMGLSHALTFGGIVNELGLSEEQVQKIREKARQLELEIRHKVEAMRAAGEAEILDLLTPAQRAKWRRMYGDQLSIGGGSPAAGDGPRRQHD